MKGDCWKKSKNLLRAACLSAALATAWGAGNPPPAAANDIYHVTGSFDSLRGAPYLNDTTLSSVTILYGYNASAIDNFLPSFSTQTLTHGVDIDSNMPSVDFSLNLQTNPPRLYQYTIVGLFDNGGVTIGMKPDWALDAVATGPNWGLYFPDGLYGQGDVAGLIANNPSALENFFFDYGLSSPAFAPYLGLQNATVPSTTPMDYYGDFTLGNMTLVNFPLAVPEPGTLLFLVFSSGVAVLLRRTKEDG